MNYICAIDLVNEQLKQLYAIRDRGDYLAAGLSITLCVGPPPTEDATYVTDMDVGIVGEPEALLNLLIQSLEASKKFRIQSATDHIEELQQFLGVLK